MFETIVKQYVKIALDNKCKTEFFNGTLFVSSITEEQARKVFFTLNDKFGLGKVQVSPVGDTGEYAYDFI